MPSSYLHTYTRTHEHTHIHTDLALHMSIQGSKHLTGSGLLVPTNLSLQLPLLPLSAASSKHSTHSRAFTNGPIPDGTFAYPHTCCLLIPLLCLLPLPISWTLRAGAVSMIN